MNILKPPKHLSKEARAWWKLMTKSWDLDEAGLMLLRQALEAYDRILQAQAEVMRDGLVIVDPSGRKRAHPALQTEKEARLCLLRAWRQLGLDIEPPGPIGRPPGR